MYLLKIGTAHCCDECQDSPCDECEPPVCCLYPGPLNPNTGEAQVNDSDLPDSVSLTTSQGTFILPHIGGFTFRLGTSYQILGSGGAYLVQESSGHPPQFAGQIGQGTCLVSDMSMGAEFDEPTCIVEDHFHDTYTVTVTGASGGSVTVIRQDTCTWKGGVYTLRYGGEPRAPDNNHGPSGPPYRWKVNGHAKTGLHNTPVGSYADGYSVA